MGAITNHNIEQIKRDYNLKYFVETGTGRDGEAVVFCLKFDFVKYFTVELIREFYELAKRKFTLQDNVKLYHGKSEKMLPVMLKEIPKDRNILFWMDAHLPSEYSKDYDNSDLELAFPLENELKVIKQSRDTSKDYFIIDDLRIYENNACNNGNAPVHHKHPTQHDIQFIYDLFEDTHTITKDRRQEGYVIIAPKQ